MLERFTKEDAAVRTARASIEAEMALHAEAARRRVRTPEGSKVLLVPHLGPGETRSALPLPSHPRPSRVLSQIICLQALRSTHLNTF